MHLSNEAARAVFLDRHHLIAPPTATVAKGGVAEIVARLGFVQVDSINTVERAHHMILWSRAHGYRPADLRAGLERDRSLWEHWTHDASILPIGLYPYWKDLFARDEVRLRENWRKWFRDGYDREFGTILNQIAKNGPVSSSDVGQDEPRGKGGWWDWHPSKAALEWLWRTGKIAVTRRDGFKKVYDLTENVIPKPSENVIPKPFRDVDPDPIAVTHWACRSALLQLGFASIPEIAAYWNAVDAATVKAWIAAAVATGEVRDISYDSHDSGHDSMPIKAYALTEDLPGLAPPVPTGRRLRILSPFDPALRDRKRAERLFNFSYRIEVFTPAPKRQYGYYVFPVLAGAQLIGRIDVKAFRAENRLAVAGFWPEPGVTMTLARQAALQGQLQRLAGLAGVEQVDFTGDWLKT
jgi:uncharacterized protein YcaQ